MILVLGGIKGGVGKSTLAANLAVLSRVAGLDTLLVDADTQATTMTWAAARAENPLAASNQITTIALTGKQARAELLQLDKKYDVIVVDAGARDSVSQRAALSAANVVLLPFPPRGPDLWTLDAVCETLADIRTINESLRAVAFVNRADAQGNDNAEAEAAFAEHAEHLDAAPVRIGTRKAIATAHLAGLSVVETPRPDTKAVMEVHALHQYVFGIIKALK